MRIGKLQLLNKKVLNIDTVNFGMFQGVSVQWSVCASKFRSEQSTGHIKNRTDKEDVRILSFAPRRPKARFYRFVYALLAFPPRIAKAPGLARQYVAGLAKPMR